MQINFLITVSTNIMLSSLIPRILQLLHFSFILLYCLHFMLVKIIPIIFQINIKLKISPSTNHLVKVMISTCIQTPCKFSRLCLYSKRRLRALQLSKWCKSENVRKGTWKERKASYLIRIRLTFIDKLCVLKTLYMQNKLLNCYERW